MNSEAQRPFLPSFLRLKKRVAFLPHGSPRFWLAAKLCWDRKATLHQQLEKSLEQEGSLGPATWTQSRSRPRPRSRPGQGVKPLTPLLFLVPRGHILGLDLVVSRSPPLSQLSRRGLGSTASRKPALTPYESWLPPYLPIHSARISPTGILSKVSVQV